MPINIKNARVSHLVSELSETMGVSITESVGQAVEEKLANLSAKSARRGIAAKLMGLSQKCVQNAPEGWLTKDYDAELYDERGLPR